MEFRNDLALSQHTLLKDQRTILDNVHKNITFPTFYWKFIDCPEFQRLRDIRQLGQGCSHVFPGATHTRFEHCIGTGYLANKMINVLNNYAPKDIEITEQDIKNVTIAGLLHDIGHAVNGHAFEYCVLKKLAPDCGWSHEMASGMLLEHIVDHYSIDLEREDINVIKSMIIGEKPSHANPKRFLYQIVSNEDNSIDVDKFDYICRDSYNVGIKAVHFDYNRLIESCRVINDEICFHSKNDYNVYGLFQSRYKLFKDIYTDSTATAIDHMVGDALLEANSTYKYLECIKDAERYIKLTDSLLEAIEHSTKPELEKSRQLLKRVKTRDLYRCVGETLLNEEMDAKLKHITPEEISSYSSVLVPDDIMICNFYLNYGCKDKNPVDNVYFYNSSSALPFHIGISQTSLILPEMFQERNVQVFVKNPAHFKEGRKAFSAYCKERNIIVGEPSTPATKVGGEKFRREEIEDEVVLPKSKRSKMDLGTGHMLINN